MGRERSVRAGSSSRAVGHKKKKPYKVVLESITQKKKKLRIADSFEENAPPGYTYVPIGNVELTEQCKEFCRKRGLKAYNVSTHPKNYARADPEKVSYHLNRVGFHFPSAVVDQAMNWIGIEINGRSRAGIANNLGRRLKRYGHQPEKIAVTAAMKDLFPKMPHESVDVIVEHAFEQGANRVGNATNLSIERRVQMAVLAHVRHKHTDYDRLLKEVGYIEARKRVERPCIEKILEWRGEASDDDEEMEDDFREVIVLDDEDDDDSEVEGSGSGNSTPSIELVANEATADDLGPRDPARARHSWTEPRAGPRQMLRPLETVRIPGPSTARYVQERQPRALIEPASSESRLGFRGFDERSPLRLIPIDPPQRTVRITRRDDAHWSYARPVSRADQAYQDRYDPMPHHRSYELPPRRPGASPQTRPRPLESVQTRPIRQELPSPRDIAVPSIENEAPPYVSHQERTFMQASKESDVELIDLTGTPPGEQPRVRPEMHNGSLHSQFSRNLSGGLRYEYPPGMSHEQNRAQHRNVQVLQHDSRLPEHRRIYEDPAQTRLARQGVDTQVQSPSAEQVLYRAADRQYGVAERAPRRVEHREPPKYYHPSQLGPSHRTRALNPLDTGRGPDDVQYRTRDPPSASARQLDHDAAAVAYMRVGRPAAQPQSFHHQPFP